MDKSGVLLKLIDLATGRVPHISDAEADEMREAVQPGVTTPPPSDADIAAAQAVLDRQAASAAAATAPAAAPDLF